MNLRTPTPGPAVGRGRRLLAPALVIAALCGTALLTPLTGRTSSADSAMGAPYTGQLGTLPTCFLPSPAFCDSFSEGPYTGSAANRGGALDPAKWSFARITEGENAGQNALFAFAPVTEQFCQTKLPGVVPDRDSFMCNGTNGVTTQDQGTEDMHWMTAMNDGGDYATIGARALQPFDFSGRTGTVSFMVDAVTQGPHSTWPSLVLSDQPISMPHKNNPGVDSPPRNGFQIDWNAGCGTPATVSSGGSALSDYPQTKVGMISTFANYQEKVLSVPWQPDTVACVAAQADHPNLIQVQISQTSLDIWMADAVANMQPGMPMTPPVMKHVLHMDQSNGFQLNMTRGYLSFEQAQYAACKFNASCQRTYHWHAIGFDGPALPTDRDYEAPDSLTAAPGGQVNVGYLLNGQSSFTLKNVDLTGVTSAYVAFNWREDNNITPNLQVRLNGNAWRPVIMPPYTGYFGATNALAAIPVSDLRSGDNTLEFNTSVGGTIANIDLALDPSVGGGTTTTSSTTSSLLSSSTSSTSATLTGSTSATTSSVASQTHSSSATSTQTQATSVASQTHSSSATSTSASTASATSSTVSTASATATHSATSSTTTSASTTSTASAPTFATSAKLSHYMLYAGVDDHITANVQDLTGSLTNGKVEVEVSAPDGTRVFDQSVQVSSLGAGQTGSYEFIWKTPSTTGAYTVSIAVYGPNGALYNVNKSAATVKVV